MSNYFFLTERRNLTCPPRNGCFPLPYDSPWHWGGWWSSSVGLSCPPSMSPVSCSTPLSYPTASLVGLEVISHLIHSPAPANPCQTQAGKTLENTFEPRGWETNRCLVPVTQVASPQLETWNNFPSGTASVSGSARHQHPDLGGVLQSHSSWTATGKRVGQHHSLKSHPTPTARDMGRWLNFCSPSSPFTSMSIGNKFQLLRSGLLVATTSKWFLCLCLSHWAFSYYFLLHPTREEEIKRSWPRSAHHTREEQEIITKMQLWKKNLSVEFFFFFFLWTRTTTLHKCNSTKDLQKIVFPFLSGQ